MNRNKKKVFAAALAVCLLGILSFSTLAWFNASESVTNKFMVASTGSGTGDNNKPEDKIFSVDLWEKVDMNGDGTVADNERVSYRQDGLTGWDYDNILPGVPYDKAPTVENTGSYDQYIRMVVAVNNAQEWITVLGSYGITDLGSIFLGHDDTDTDGDPAVWECHTAGGWLDQTANTINFVYYLNEKLAPGATATLFEQVKLPGQLTQADVVRMVNSAGEVGFNIAVRADAIQTNGIEGATNAQQAFEAIGWTAGKTYTEAMTPSTNP